MYEKSSKVPAAGGAASKVKPKVPTAARQPRRERPAAREDADLDALNALAKQLGIAYVIHDD